MFYAIRNNSKITKNPVVGLSCNNDVFDPYHINYKVSDIPVYKNVIDNATGTITTVSTGKSQKGLKQVSKTNVYLKIQEYAKGMDIYSILDRCSRGLIGDIAFNQGEFIDVAGYPKDILEAHQAVKNAQKEFDDIPTELKDIFGNDPLSFVKNFSLEKLAEFVNSKTEGNKEVKDNGK